MCQKPIRILLADDDELVRISLKMILEADPDLVVAGQAEDGQVAVTAYRQLQPDILLMDIRMRPVDGLEAGERILEAFTDARILYLTTFADDEYIVRALRMGARGYILKHDYISVAPAIKAVYNNQNVFGDAIMARVPVLMQQTAGRTWRDFGLTEREAEIVEQVAEGLSNREIASQLNLSEGTVRNHISVILDKLSLRDRTQLAIFYYKHS